MDPAPTSAGSILLYRMLADYPKNKLFIISPNAKEKNVIRARYRINFPAYPFSRLFKTRFNNLWYSIIVLWQELERRIFNGTPLYLSEIIKQFQPEAILTVALAGGWLQAEGISKKLKIPLHLIVHDDHHFDNFWCAPLRKWGKRRFAQTYRGSATRFCISKPMERAFKKRYGVSGTVLMPSRGKDTLFFNKPNPKTLANTKNLLIVYAGYLSRENFERLAAVGALLAPKNCRLLAFTTFKPPHYLEKSSVEWRRPLPSNELIRWLHKNANVLLLLTDFEKTNRETIQTLFPSKMVDYTASAVPILAVAPKDASISKYIRSNPGAAYILNKRSPKIIAQTILGFKKAPWKRRELAQHAIIAGERDFAYQRCVSTFFRALRKK
ncbi:MAG: glycosyltransferase [Verrucomicrobia bacterium]|nr:glycosyltransferase [Verrucomicrobiota bacterium]